MVADHDEVGDAQGEGGFGGGDPRRPGQAPAVVVRTGVVAPSAPGIPVPVTADGPFTDEQIMAMLLASNEYFLREHAYP